MPASQPMKKTAPPAKNHCKALPLWLTGWARSLPFSSVRRATSFFNWSRSRRAPWRKGDTSGHIQELVELRIDCDGDTLLAEVEQTGVACHTGRHNCFLRAIRNGEFEEIAPVEIDMTASGLTSD